jgi:mono/diheme cytochrome c family protein
MLLALALLLLATACSEGRENVPRPDPAELGSRVYQQSCAVCHGRAGEGQPNWQVRQPDGTYPAPPHDATGHTWHHGDGLLFRYVKYGGDSLDIPGFQSGMPAFGDQLSDEEIRAVINYLKTFWEEEQREFQARASEHNPFPVDH